MKLSDYKSTVKHPLQPTTLVFLRQGDQILLARKKRGFGSDKYNGIGGKLNPDESILDAAIRETQEEITVHVKRLVQAAQLHFYYPHAPEGKDWNQTVHVYFCSDWENLPLETEEMAPAWFSIKALPFDQMWDDDKIWLPRVLAGKYVEAEFLFDAGGKVIDHTIISEV